MSKQRLDDSIFGVEPERKTRRSMREQRRLPRGKPPKRRRWGSMVFALALLVGGGYVAMTFAGPIVNKVIGPQDFDGSDLGEETSVTIPNGAYLKQAGDILEAKGIVKSAGSFITAFEGSGGTLQPGAYRLKKGMRAVDAVTALTDGKHRDENKVPIREGLWKKEVFETLAKATGRPLEEYTEAEKKIASGASQATALPASAKGNVEGFLFPATYSFPKSMSAEDQINTMISKAVNQLTAAGVAGDKMERTLIIASLIENEAKLDVDRAKIARVIENRLKIKMALQLDSTVSYASQSRTITTTNQQRASTNPYNTYKFPGLPPGPIGNPGLASIKAASDPAEGPWLYFVAVNPSTGETKYATTFTDHNVNVKQFQEWCRKSENRGKC